MKKSLLFILGLAGTTFSVIGQNQQPPNPSFETWETLPGPISNTYVEPENWNTSNECTAIINQFSVSKSSDAHTGSFSAKLETKSSSFPGVIINGVLTTADMICLAQGGGQEGGIAYTQEMTPDSIVVWYKYAPATGDSAYSQIMFLANNDQDTVSYTRVNIVGNASEWTRLSAPLNPTTGTPEKLSLFFSSSYGDGSQGQAVVGSVLFVDDVELIYNPAGINDDYNNSKWNVYPNPVINELNVSVAPGQKGKLEILDVTGKRVRLVKVSEATRKIDVSQLATGIYLYQFKDLNDRPIRTGKLMVNP
ncbi:MAG: T9SS type A sorting domain-containing protein [Flavobacteriales bacterium]|nr:T9SS type A sorting domain-containing protein [Flavobacteriales bacterium]